MRDTATGDGRRGAPVYVDDEWMPRPSRLRLGLAVTGLVLYVGVVLLATLSPTPLDQGYESTIDRFLGLLHRAGVPEWFGYGKLEFAANVVMFIPLGLLLALALPRAGQWIALPVVVALSGVIEVLQAQLLAARFGSVWDVVANTLGGVIGVAAAVLVRHAVHVRDEKVIALAAWGARQRLVAQRRQAEQGHPGRAEESDA